MHAARPRRSPPSAAAPSGTASWASAKTASPTLPILHLLDTRSAAEVAARARRTRPHRLRPALQLLAGRRLLWLAEHNSQPNSRPPDAGCRSPNISVRKTVRPRAALHLDGLRHRSVGSEHERLRRRNPRRHHLDRAMLADPATFDRPAMRSAPRISRLWPAFDRDPWFPALGDGACNNVGSGAVGEGSLCLNGRHHRRDARHHRSSAHRYRPRPVVLSPRSQTIRHRRRSLQRRRSLRLDEAHPARSRRISKLGSKRPPPAPTASPCCRFSPANDRPTGDPTCARAITGMSLHTDPFDILRASLESVALRFREIYRLLVENARHPRRSHRLRRRAAQLPRLDADDGRRARPAHHRLHRTRSLLPRRGAMGCSNKLGAIANYRLHPRRPWARPSTRAEYEPIYDHLLGTASTLQETLCMTPDLHDRASRIRLLLMDCRRRAHRRPLLNVPGPDGKMVETKMFDSQDGIALQWLSWHDIQTGVISGRSLARDRRARPSGQDDLRLPGPHRKNPDP